jgi:ATP-dependent protease HslVU (ClpYQ) peptidase subunit
VTTIAYKNGILAADRRATVNNWTFETTKIRRLSGGRLAAGAGDFAFVLAMYAWLEAGAKVEDFPADQRSEKEWEPVLVVARDGTLLRYERTPYPIEVSAPFYAQGSGRDYALMAMRLGKSAPEAVQLAAEFDPSTGPTVDTLTISPSAGELRPPSPTPHRPVYPYVGDAMAGATAVAVPTVGWNHQVRPQEQFLQEPGGRVPGRA